MDEIEKEMKQNLHGNPIMVRVVEYVSEDYEYYYSGYQNGDSSGSTFCRAENPFIPSWEDLLGFNERPYRVSIKTKSIAIFLHLFL